MPYDKLRYSIVGLGHIAEKAYLAASQDLEKAELAAVCDADAVKAAAWAAKFGISAYSDFHNMLDSEQLDFIVNLTPHSVHAEVIRAAAGRGVSVFTEKPPVMSLGQAHEIDGLVKASGIRLMVGLQRRFSRTYANFRRTISRIENPFLIEARYSMYINGLGEGWRSSVSLAGGGCLIDMGYHMIDLIIWYFGLPDRVCMESSAVAAPESVYDVEDTALVLFGYKRGLYGSLTLSRAYRPEAEYLMVTGSNGSCTIDRERAVILDRQGRVVDEERVDYDMAELVRRQLDYFVDVVRGSNPEFTGMECNMEHMTFLDACYRSRSSGRYVAIDRVEEDGRTAKRCGFGRELV